MRFSFSHLLSLAALSVAAQGHVVKRGYSSFPSVDGLQFKIDGKTEYYRGTNAWWLSRLPTRPMVDLVLDHIKESGFKIVRTWGFSDISQEPAEGDIWFQALIPGKPPRINTGPTGLQRLDYVVQAATQRGLKVIIPFVNNYPDYGGMDVYRAYYNANTTQGFYKSTAVQNRYKVWIKTLVDRYKDSTGLFAWELANEARCTQCPTSVITNWARDASAYVKSLDPYHMVALGTEGMGIPGDTVYPYTYYEGNDFIAQLGIKTLDFQTVHLFPDSWAVTAPGFGSQWIKDHGKACVAAGKPCLLEEYGNKTNHCKVERPWQVTALNTKGIAADQFWQYGDTPSDNEEFSDDYSIFRGRPDYTCLVDVHRQEVDQANGD